MEEEKYQKELFEFDQPKKSFSRLSDILPRADFEGRIMLTISLEKLIFISIGIIMVMVVLYALGVENGKLFSKEAGFRSVKQGETPILPPALQNRASTIPTKSILSTAPVVTLVKPVLQTKPTVQNALRAQPASQLVKPYTILAGTFYKIENARTVGAILVKQGFTVTISYSAPYYMVMVGAYADKNLPDIQRDLARVKHIYKDAAIKVK